MKTSDYLKLRLPDYIDAADILELAANFEKLEKRAPAWTDFANSGTVLESAGDFTVATEFPVAQTNQIFAITLKMPRAFAEGDTITVDGIAYNLYQGTDPALSDAWKAGEVVTINFDKVSRRCWASAGGGAPRPLPAQVSNMQASTPEGETPSIVFTWNNPSDENFAGMVLIVKEGSAPNGVTDGVQAYKGTGTTFTYIEGVQWEHTYFARGFAYNSQNKYQLDATGAIASATPSNVPDQVSDVELVGSKGSMTLTWVNPTQLSFDKVKVVQKIDSDPENPNDGTEVYSGTDTTVTVSGLQDSINYHFAIFAIGKNGKYKDPVTKTYTPAIYPKYDYTGQHTLLKDNAELGWWRIKFLSSGVLTWLSEDTEIDVFLVGGGGAAGSYGGGGGYTRTVKKIKLTKGQGVQIEVGAGAPVTDGNASGGASKFDVYDVSGASGTNGGSGGGGEARSDDHLYGGNSEGGNGGSDGSNGGVGTYTGGSKAGGSGQGTTTREFGDAGADLYSGGGGGAATVYGTNYYDRYARGGSGGQGRPALATNGTSYQDTSEKKYARGMAGGGYGGGAGGGTNTSGRGAQGIVIIRDARS